MNLKLEFITLGIKDQSYLITRGKKKRMLKESCCPNFSHCHLNLHFYFCSQLTAGEPSGVLCLYLLYSPILTYFSASSPASGFFASTAGKKKSRTRCYPVGAQPLTLRMDTHFVPPKFSSEWYIIFS